MKFDPNQSSKCAIALPRMRPCASRLYGARRRAARSVRGFGHDHSGGRESWAHSIRHRIRASNSLELERCASASWFEVCRRPIAPRARRTPKWRPLLAAKEGTAGGLLRIRRAAMPDRKNSKPSDYVVGCRRPPKATRFTAGKSGNPRGRPKGSRSVGALLHGLKPDDGGHGDGD
jgi:Family of unknown function (DUF5681)